MSEGRIQHNLFDSISTWYILVFVLCDSLFGQKETGQLGLFVASFPRFIRGVVLYISAPSYVTRI